MALLFTVFVIGSFLSTTYSQSLNISCIHNKSCSIDCAKQTINGIYSATVHCAYGTTIKAYEALNLHILCNNAYGCKQLQIECPKQDDWDPAYNFCRMDCIGDNACFESQIIEPESNFIEVNCMQGNRTCNRMKIVNTKQRNSYSISCNSTTVHNDPICESLEVIMAESAVLHLNCSANGICNNISIVSTAVDITISVFDGAQLTNSILNVTALMFAIELYGKSALLRNNIYVNKVSNISITSDFQSVFEDNNIYIYDLKDMLIKHLNLSHSNIHVNNAAIIHLYDALLCNKSYLNASFGNILDVRNTEMMSYSAIDAQHMHYTNVYNGIIDASILNVSNNKEVNIVNVSLHNNAQIVATNVDKVGVNIATGSVANGHSLIDAKYANNFSLICSGFCDEHLSIYTPNKSELSAAAHITCIKYGCKALDLYTFNNADDITFTASECDCDEDIDSACVGSWNIYCGYDTMTHTYLHESHFNSATECIGDNSICCGNILHSMHEAQCKWPTNKFECLPNTHCIIDCYHVNNTNNVYNNFSCNTQQSSINATQALSLTVFCHGADIGSCTNLTVFCPKTMKTSRFSAECHVYCDGDHGCNLLKIDIQTSSNFVLDCSADKTCTDVMITNRNQAIESDKVELKCMHDACSKIQMYKMGETNLNVQCSDGVCNELWLDCDHCNQFKFICTQHVLCSNSVLKATDVTHFELECSSINTDKGCHNISIYVPSYNEMKKQKAASIWCDSYGCNALNVYSLLSATVSDAIMFTVTNCACFNEMDTLCVAEWKLYCNKDIQTASVFSNGICCGDCCGDIIEAFHEPICSPFDCAMDQNAAQCVVNCTYLAKHSYLCRNQVIKPQITTTSLDVYCTKNVSCTGLDVYCTQECNIYCEGSMNCRNMTIYTKDISVFTFTCDGYCADIFINNENIDTISNNIIAIHCDNSTCDTIHVNGAFVSAIHIFGSNATITNSIFNVQHAETVYMNASSMKNITIDANNARNINIINHHTIYNMIVDAANSKNVSIKCADCNACGLWLKANYSSYVYSYIDGNIDDLIIDATYAGHIFMDVARSTKIADKNQFILNANYASFLQLNVNGAILTHQQINTQNVTQYIVSGDGSIKESVIDCDSCHQLDIQLAKASNCIIHMNYGDILNILGTILFTNNTVNGNILHLLNITNNSNMSMNTFYALSSQTVAVQIAIDSVFLGNMLYINDTKSVHILNSGHFTKNVLHGDNISNLFNLSCFESSSVCGQQDVLLLNHAKNINIEIGANAQNENMFNIVADHATSIRVHVFGLLMNSSINAQYATYLFVECNANHTQFGCHDVSIISSPVINDEPSSHLTCTQYGCSELRLFTRHDASDINITADKCPCDEDVVSLCIDKWHIHCRNESISLFTGFNHCDGFCCGSIQKTLKEAQCSLKKGKHKNKEWIIYMVIGTVFGLYLIAAIIWIIIKRKQRPQRLDSVDYIRTY